MATDSPPRRHFHRGRRGHERRSSERRGPQQQVSQPAPEPSSRGDRVDVEQIMRDIRAKIAQRHGIELTDQQVQELAARRLESILDPRTVKPALLDQLRRAAGTRPETVAAADRAEAPYAFEDTTLYDSPNAVVRFFRKVLNPLLKLFFNPNPLIRALNVQARLNAETIKREAERDQRQAEWNALHYELLQRMVTEVAKVSLEVQSLGLRVESLSTKVDFNERRVRGIEGAMHQSRPPAQRERDRERDRDREPTPQPVAQQQPILASPAEVAEAPAPSSQESAQGDAPRRRRRRRRGRRGGGAGESVAPGTAESPATPDAVEGDDGEEGDVELPDTATTEGEAVVAPVAASAVTADPFTPPPIEPEIRPEPDAEHTAGSAAQRLTEEPTPERDDGRS